jgi:hypothetical protein
MGHDAASDVEDRQQRENPVCRRNVIVVVIIVIVDCVVRPQARKVEDGE